MSKCLKSSII